MRLFAAAKQPAAAMAEPVLFNPKQNSQDDGEGGPTCYSANNASQTEIKVEKVTHNWTVKNFSHCYQEYLENFVHLNKNEDTLTWSVKIYPKGNGENNKDFVFLCLNRVTTPSTGSSKFGKIGFKSRFTLRTAEGKEIEMRIHPNPSHSDYVSYIKRDVLFPQIMPQDVIIVSVEIDVAVETVTTSSDDQISLPNTDLQLIDDYQKLLKDDASFADFAIRVGEREFRVHRAILAARSDVLQAMLSHDTDEAKNSYMEIKDLDSEVVWEMLNFIYSGRCPRGLSEMGGDLLIAADKYSLTDLKLLCERALINDLSIENACSLLILSDVHSAPRLREKAVEFILANSRQVTKTHGWSLMLEQHRALVTEIVQNFQKAPAVNLSMSSTSVSNAAAGGSSGSGPPGSGGPIGGQQHPSLIAVPQQPGGPQPQQQQQQQQQAPVAPPQQQQQQQQQVQLPGGGGGAGNNAQPNNPNLPPNIPHNN